MLFSACVAENSVNNYCQAIVSAIVGLNDRQVTGTALEKLSRIQAAYANACADSPNEIEQHAKNTEGLLKNLLNRIKEAAQNPEGRTFEM